MFTSGHQKFGHSSRNIYFINRKLPDSNPSSIIWGSHPCLVEKICCAISVVPLTCVRQSFADPKLYFNYLPVTQLLKTQTMCTQYWHSVNSVYPSPCTGKGTLLTEHFPIFLGCWLPPSSCWWFWRVGVGGCCLMDACVGRILSFAIIGGLPCAVLLINILPGIWSICAGHSVTS